VKGAPKPVARPPVKAVPDKAKHVFYHGGILVESVVYRDLSERFGDGRTVHKEGRVTFDPADVSQMLRSPDGRMTFGPWTCMDDVEIPQQAEVGAPRPQATSSKPRWPGKGR